ncbi:MAG: TlpA family protein disulfide reductase, partial [Nitrospira sp.]
MFSDAFAGFDQDWEIELPPDVVRGRVKLQVSSITITVPNGSSTEVIIHADIRAQYYPDPGTTEMPPSVHGEVRAAFDVRQTPHGAGRRLLIQPSAQDAKIEFIASPGSGLTAAAVSRIAAEVRKFIREGVSLLPVDLPTDFVFTDFKGLGSGPNQVIALPFQLSGAAPPPNGLQSLTQSFIGPSGFGFAVSKEHVNTLIDLEAIRQAIRDRRPVVLKISSIFGVSVSVEYRLRFSSGPTLTFKNGAIEIAGRVAAETDTSWAPNGFVSFKQRVILMLDPTSQRISLERAGEPDVDKSWFIPHGRAVNIVRVEIDNALKENRAAIRRVFDDARSALTKGLRTFDSGASASYTAIDITTDGVVVRGEIRSLGRHAPVVKIGETHSGAAFTALESWIPAGRIDRFVWTWVEHSGPASIWSGVERSFVDEHRFILPKPTGVANVSQICLRIEGTQITPSGQQVSIAGGTTCQVQEPEFEMDLPPWWGPLTIPFWRPNLADNGLVRHAIAGHMSVQASVPGDIQAQRNVLVYFVDGRRDRPLDPLIEALSRTRNSASVVTTVVLPADTFDTSRREVESRLGLPREGVPPLHFTEDDEGGWTRTFGVSSTPSMYLINARREFVWTREGEPDPSEVAAALDKYVVSTAPSRFRPLRLTVSPGDAAVDAKFEYGGHQYALHRMRGRDVLLNFWQSWSAPCLLELQRLQHLHQEGRQVPFIVGFHGGAKSEAVDDVRHRLGLSYPLVQDHQQQMARRYGIEAFCYYHYWFAG